MKNYDLSFYEKKKVNSAEELKPKGYEKQIECDIKFLKQFSDKNKVLLDLGSGIRLTINSLINDFKKIYAIEKFEHFSKFINENIVVINKDIREIEYKNNFDIVSAFGVFNHLNDKDTFSLYKKEDVNYYAIVGVKKIK